MTTRDQPRHGCTAVLRRQPARIAWGQPEGGYTGMIELFCCDCGDDPGLDYFAVSPGFTWAAGPYPLAGGVAAYEKHL